MHAVHIVILNLQFSLHEKKQVGQPIALRHQVFTGLDPDQAQSGQQRGRKRRSQIVSFDKRFFQLAVIDSFHGDSLPGLIR
ncbi:hypothetical protein [Serratia marcescens]|uniref:hypothetical protein n=1 Tax=Serratia marcescens TaxID=615 RepID=UPI002022D452|nr:hypothetical protein [Serratia marcescens]